MIEDGKVFVRYLDGVPLTVRGVTTPNPDGTFSVYINAGLPEETQRAALEHELYHIEHDHLYNHDPVAVNEQQASGKVLSFPVHARRGSKPIPPTPQKARHRKKAAPAPEKELDAATRRALEEWCYQMIYGNKKNYF